jgi:hypothetical protein
MTVTTETSYVDVLFELPDGRQALVTITKDGRYRMIERANHNPSTAWGPPTEGTVFK